MTAIEREQVLGRSPTFLNFDNLQEVPLPEEDKGLILRDISLFKDIIASEIKIVDSQPRYLGSAHSFDAGVGFKSEREAERNWFRVNKAVSLAVELAALEAIARDRSSSGKLDYMMGETVFINVAESRMTNLVSGLRKYEASDQNSRKVVPLESVSIMSFVNDDDSLKPRSSRHSKRRGWILPTLLLGVGSGIVGGGALVSNLFNNESGTVEVAPILDEEREGVIQLTSFGHNVSPSFSPDGTSIAFTSDRDGAFNIWTMKADGSDQTKLFHSDGFDGYPNWSPDGTSIAYVSNRGENLDIWVVDSGGLVRSKLTDLDGISNSPTWSPDGKNIAFVSNSQGNFDIWLVGVEGKVPTRVTNSEGSEVSPTWSPDGKNIAFVSYDGGDSSAKIMDLDSLQQTEVFVGGRFPISSLAWSPDQGHIALVLDREQSGEIWLLDTNTGTSEQLEVGDVFGGSGISWSPDGKSIVFTSLNDGLRQISTSQIEQLIN